MFILICAVCIPVSGFSRDICLIISYDQAWKECLPDPQPPDPIMAGMEVLTFGMTLGAIAG